MAPLIVTCRNGALCKSALIAMKRLYSVRTDGYSVKITTDEDGDFTEGKPQFRGTLHGYFIRISLLGCGDTFLSSFLFVLSLPFFSPIFAAGVRAGASRTS